MSTWIASACDAKPAAWEGSVRDSAGVRLVANPTTPLWPAADTPRPRERMRIPSERAGAYQLANVVSLAVRADGHVFALDAQAQAVQEFSRDGEWVRTIGGPGRGPGEFGEDADALWLGAGDTLFVADVGTQRVLRFAPDGQPAGGFPIPFSGGIAYNWRTDATGRVVHALVLFSREGSTSELIVARDQTGAVTDTLVRLPALERMGMGPAGPTLVIFAPEATWDVAADGTLLTAVTDDFRVRRYDRFGTLHLELTFPAGAHAVSAADEDVYREATIRLWEGRVPARMHAALRQNARFHDRYPAFAALRAGPAGSIWVQRFRRAADVPARERVTFDAERDIGADTWDVFDADGRYLGPVQLPPRFTPLRFVGTDVYGVQRDADDLQSVIGVRLEGFPVP